MYDANGHGQPLPQRVYGTHLPYAFYSSTPGQGTYRGVARVPTVSRIDLEMLGRVRDGLQRLGTVGSR